MAHGQMGFQLTHGIQHHADHNQQTGATEKLRNHERNSECVVQEHRKQRQHLNRNNW